MRYSLLFVLGLGGFACIAAFIKLGYVVNYGKLGDWLWDSHNLTIWAVVECNMGIVADSLSCLRPLLRSILGTMFGTGSCQSDPAGSSANSRSGQRMFRPSSGKSRTWWTLSSAQKVGDDTSRERALNATSREEYELGGGSTSP